MTRQILEKLHSWLSKIMNNKQELVYGVLESTNDLRSVFVGHTYLLKNFPVVWQDSRKRNKISFYHIYS